MVNFIKNIKNLVLKLLQELTNLKINYLIFFIKIG